MSFVDNLYCKEFCESICFLTLWSACLPLQSDSFNVILC